MARARGEGDVCLGADVGEWGAEGAGRFVGPSRRGTMFFCAVCLDSKCSEFCGEFKCR